MFFQLTLGVTILHFLFRYQEIIKMRMNNFT
jgi:hypothetical protein